MQAQKKKVNLALFASGSGSNAEAIIRHFEGHSKVKVSLIVSNKPNAGVIERANRLQIPFHIVPKADFNNPNSILEILDKHEVDWIILAGWLLLIPEYLVAKFENGIINIHPALLPKFGGKGMYGRHVHDAVLAAGEKDSGITIHFVNKHFDEGAVIAQYSVPIKKSDDVNDVEGKVRELELQNYSQVIEKTVLSN